MSYAANPTFVPSRCAFALIALALLLPSGLSAASNKTGKSDKSKPTQQTAKPLQIPVEPLGFAPISPQFVSQFSTLFTVNFVDETHLLFTFNARTLLQRLPDVFEGDEDRNVAAVLLEIPSGRVLARTEWRTRDRSQYLWPLAHGRFLLRVRSRLTVIDPLANLAAHGPDAAFTQTPFLDLKRRIAYLTVSPARDLLAIETTAPPKPKQSPIANDSSALAAAMAGTSDGSRDGDPEILDGTPHRPPVEIDLFRLSTTPTGSLTASVAGVIGSRALVELPVTSEGFLEMKRENAALWDFDFIEHSGKRIELAAYETSCAPRPFFISPSEFIAFGCHGSADHEQFSYFNLHGDQPWIAAPTGNRVSPYLATAPAADRFALSQTLVSDTALNTEELTPSELLSQDVTVYQAFSGQQLLTVQAQPIERAGQNFDLSPSGLQFAVLRAGNLELYRLPPTTAADQKSLQIAQASQPAPSDAPIHLNSSPMQVAAKSPAPQPASQPAAPQALQQPAAPISTEGALGDQNGPTRKRPSLLSDPNASPDSTQPSEKPPQ